MSHPLGICLITATYWPGWGGAERQCRLLARELRRLGHEATVLTRRRPDAPPSQRIDGVPVHRTPAPGSGLVRSLAWTLTATAWLRQHGRRFDVLQCYQLLSPAYAGLLARGRRQTPGGRRQPVVIRPACSGPYGDAAEVRRLPLTGLRTRLLRQATAFVTLTAEIEAELASLGLGAIACHRIPNAVDTAALVPAAPEERRRLRARLALPQDRPLCLFAGRMTPQKGPEILLEAWTRRPETDAHLCLVGDGPLRPALEARAAAGPAAASITFAGAVEDAADYLRAADLLVLPSRAEGMSNVILEAMACGVPVITSDLAGSRDVLGADRRRGWLVPPEDPGALAEAIQGLLASPPLRAQIGNAARAAALERFTLQKVAAEYIALYEELHG
jgi:glycosyltransferase involved in cell wall biosynthesis